MIGTVYYICGFVLTLLFLILSWLSASLLHPIDPTHTPFYTFLSIYIAAGAVYLMAVVFLLHNSSKPVRLIWILVVGAAMRIAMLPSSVILEDDLYRYLWDGAVTASLINPYRYAPHDVIQQQGAYPAKLDALAKHSKEVVHKINHPHIRAIYPPVAQGIFAIAYLIKPWSVMVLRSIILLFDIITAGFLILLLRYIQLPLAMILIYWWNPLVIKEVINACHMDIFALALITAALYSFVRIRPIASSLCIVLATAVKVWPAVLLLLLWRSLLSGKYKNHTALLYSISLTVLITIPMVFWVLAGQISDDSGFVAYTLSWQNNDFFFRLLRFIVTKITRLVDGNIYQVKLYTRLLTIIGYGIALLILCRRPVNDSKDLIRKFSISTIILFIISPTQFPWYYLWIIPFATLMPFWPILLYCPLLPIYYLQYYLPLVGYPDQFYRTIIWLEHIPIWIAMGIKFLSTIASFHSLSRIKQLIKSRVRSV